jgi:hypothetical protein
MPSESTAIQARTVYRQEAEPSDTAALWLDTNTSPPTLKQYNTNTSAWEAVATSSVTVQDTAPPSPNEGDLWVDTSGTVPILKSYDAGNGTWIRTERREASVTLIDFEDGDTSEFTDLQNGGITAQTGTVYEGTYAGELTFDGTSAASAITAIGDPYPEIGEGLRLYVQTNGNDSTRYRIGIFAQSQTSNPDCLQLYWSNNTNTLEVENVGTHSELVSVSDFTPQNEWLEVTIRTSRKGAFVTIRRETGDVWHRLFFPDFQHESGGVYLEADSKQQRATLYVDKIEKLL